MLAAELLSPCPLPSRNTKHCGLGGPVNNLTGLGRRLGHEVGGAQDHRAAWSEGCSYLTSGSHCPGVTALFRSPPHRAVSRTLHVELSEGDRGPELLISFNFFTLDLISRSWRLPSWTVQHVGAGSPAVVQGPAQQPPLLLGQAWGLRPPLRSAQPEPSCDSEACRLQEPTPAPGLPVATLSLHRARISDSEG